MLLEPLFEREEALVLLDWLDKVDSEPPVRAGTMEKLKKLIGVWTT